MIGLRTIRFSIAFADSKRTCLVSSGKQTGADGGAAWEFDRSAIEGAILGGTRSAIERTLIELQGEIKRTLSRKGTGRTYRIGKTRKRLHTASAPGQPPAVRTGTLRRSWQYGRTFAGSDFAIGRVGSNLKYAPWLEFGTARMAARPYLRPATRKVVETRLRLIFRRYISSALRVAGFRARIT
jgi:hypothetical protein